MEERREILSTIILNERDVEERELEESDRSSKGVSPSYYWLGEFPIINFINYYFNIGCTLSSFILIPF